MRKIENTEVILLNDKKLYNARYRQGIIDHLIDRNVKTYSLEKLWQVYKIYFVQYRSHKKYILISSNLRTNIKVLCLYPWRFNMILNGFGRHRNITFVRKCISLLIWLRNPQIFVQNYADFRYLRRYYHPGNMIYMPGSGGTERSFNGNRCALVTRPEKLGTTINSVHSFLKSFPSQELAVVGISDGLFELRRAGVFFQGYVPQSKIFTNCNSLLVPSGYGEGFPHVLADAMCSGLLIYIERKSFLQYNLVGKVKIVAKKNDWLVCKPIRYKAAEYYSKTVVNHLVIQNMV